MRDKRWLPPFMPDSNFCNYAHPPNVADIPLGEWLPRGTSSGPIEECSLKEFKSKTADLKWEVKQREAFARGELRGKARGTLVAYTLQSLAARQDIPERPCIWKGSASQPQH